MLLVGDLFIVRWGYFSGIYSISQMFFEVLCGFPLLKFFYHGGQ